MVPTEGHNFTCLNYSTFSGSKTTEEDGDERINIFSVASGHLYERFLRIMMLSVLKHTSTPVKFWFLKNYLSPTLKVSLWGTGWVENTFLLLGWANPVQGGRMYSVSRGGSRSLTRATTICVPCVECGECSNWLICNISFFRISYLIWQKNMSSNMN